MEVAGLILAIDGVLLTIMLAGPTLGWITRTLSSMKRWTIDRHVDHGDIQKLEHFAYEEWHHSIDVDANGTATHRINTRIVNRDRKKLRIIHFPVYADSNDVAPSDLKAWARVRNQELETEVVNWTSSPRARGLVAVRLHSPLAQGQAVRLRWGYTMPRTFRHGDEYYNWDWSNEISEASGVVAFSKEWGIRYAEWTEEPAGIKETPQIEGNQIRWSLRFPERGTRAHLAIGLVNQDSATKD